MFESTLIVGSIYIFVIFVSVRIWVCTLSSYLSWSNIKKCHIALACTLLPALMCSTFQPSEFHQSIYSWINSVYLTVHKSYWNVRIGNRKRARMLPYNYYIDMFKDVPISIDVIHSYICRCSFMNEYCKRIYSIIPLVL